MASIFMRFMDILRGKKTAHAHVVHDQKLDEERAEQGLALSGIDSDPRTTQALSDQLGIRTRLDEERKNAA